MFAFSFLYFQFGDDGESGDESSSAMSTDDGDQSVRGTPEGPSPPGKDTTVRRRASAGSSTGRSRSTPRSTPRSTKPGKKSRSSRGSRESVDVSSEMAGDMVNVQKEVTAEMLRLMQTAMQQKAPEVDSSSSLAVYGQYVATVSANLHAKCEVDWINEVCRNNDCNKYCKHDILVIHFCSTSLCSYYKKKMTYIVIYYLDVVAITFVYKM